MAWSVSAMFREWPLAAMANSMTPAWAGLDGDTIKAALYNNTTAPDKDAAVGLTGYAAATSQWVVGNEVTDSDGSVDWAAGGIALGTKTLTTPSTGVFQFDAADTTHSNTVTLTNAFGTLVYDDTITGGTVADQGVCFNYFGGGQTVTTGTFTIVWHANGIFRVTV